MTKHIITLARLQWRDEPAQALSPSEFAARIAQPFVGSRSADLNTAFQLLLAEITEAVKHINDARTAAVLSAASPARQKFAEHAAAILAAVVTPQKADLTDGLRAAQIAGHETREVAEVLGVSDQTLVRWRIGKHLPETPQTRGALLNNVTALIDRDVTPGRTLARTTGRQILKVPRGA